MTQKEELVNYLMFFLDLVIEDETKITFPEVDEISDSSSAFSTSHKKPRTIGDNIAAKQIQRLCPSVDTTSLQSKGKIICHPKTVCMFPE